MTKNELKTYRVGLTRIYQISIRAENEEHARIFSEFYLGDSPDLSDKKEQDEKHFRIDDIELVYNEAHEIIS